ncbi:MAG TPA: hypothetical protein VGF82_08100 [Terracidiphilus sp.]|jgi:hypothetical protein
MHFRVECTVDGLIERGFEESITYDLARVTTTNVSIQKNDPLPGESQSKSVTLKCTTSQDLDRTNGVDALEASIANSKDGFHANFEGHANDRVQLIYAVVDPFFKQLRSDLENATMLLKWRYGITDRPLKSFAGYAESLSVDGLGWRSISPIRGIKVVFTGAYGKITTSVADDIRKMHEAGIETPLALQLLVEAKNQMKTYPRSALVIGVAAAEIALKQLIADLVPDARWLVEKLSSPPALQIARSYIPSLKVKAHFQGTNLELPKELLNQLNNAVELRNKTVHAGATPPDFETLTGIMMAMEDIVWICSLYAGYPWAGEFISYETKSSWK